MSADVIATAGSGVAKIGRYFTVVSLLPATVFVSYAYLLLRATNWFGPVDWGRLAEFRPQDLVLLAIVALIVALTLNPLQFPLIQLFEGYWGTSALAVELAAIRIAHHRRRRQLLEARERTGAVQPANPLAAPAALRRAVLAAESGRLRTGYPDVRRVLPTRLGNVLRRYEDAISKPYGLDPLVAVPRLAMVAGRPEVEYVENQRVQMELAIRTTFLALVAAPMTVAVMWRGGLWLLLAAVPYAVAFFAYRGAVAVAHEYGTSLAVLTDMTRFALYERLHVPRPLDTLAERTTNRRLGRLFSLRDDASLTYEYAKAPTSGGDAIP